MKTRRNLVFFSHRYHPCTHGPHGKALDKHQIVGPARQLQHIPAGSTVPETMKRQFNLTSVRNTFDNLEGATGSPDSYELNLSPTFKLTNANHGTEWGLDRWKTTLI